MALLTDAYTAVPQSSPSQASRPSLARRKTIARDLTTGSRKVIANVGCGYFWPDQPAEPPSPVSPAEPYLFRPEFLAVLRIPISVANTGACGVSWRAATARG
jgi:hypothetical protein